MFLADDLPPQNHLANFRQVACLHSTVMRINNAEWKNIFFNDFDWCSNVARTTLFCVNL